MPPERAEQLAAAARALEALRKQHPDDLSVAIAEALVALGLPDPGRIDPALDRLESRWSTRPRWRPLPEGARANSRQRAAGRAAGPALAGRPRLLEAAAGLGTHPRWPPTSSRPGPSRRPAARPTTRR